MKHRYLVTGAQGFIGRYLVHELLSRSEDCVILGIGRSPRQDVNFLHRLTWAGHSVDAPLPEALHVSTSPRYSYLSVDLLGSELQNVLSEFGPTAVIHLAASLRGDTDESILRHNLRNTDSLLQALLANGIGLQMILLASSGGVYGKQGLQPITEDAPPTPIDNYARSKLLSEEMVKSFAQKSATPTAIARIFNVFGPGQDEFHLAGRLVSQIGSLEVCSSPLVIHTRSLDSTRDFIDVRDVSMALALLLEQQREGIYNVGSGVETSAGDLLTLFLQSAGLAGKVKIEPDTRVIDPIPRHAASIHKIAATGFGPIHSPAATCCDMLEYYRRLICRLQAAPRSVQVCAHDLESEMDS